MPDLTPDLTPSTLQARLGLQAPILQAPMAGVSTPALAAAVSNAGGLGAIGIGASTVEQARDMITRTAALTRRSFNVNVFCHSPARRDAQREAAWVRHLAPLFAEVGAEPPVALHEIYRSYLDAPDMQALLLALRPAVVSFHFGLPPAAHIRALHACGIVTLATATSLHEAALIERAGVDAIVAQGFEAGGHRGVFDPTAPDEQLPTLDLVRRLVPHTRLPVIAAGGLMNGQDVRAALTAGAAAAQLGTAFVPCPESSASAAHRAQLHSADAAHTCMTTVLSGRPARGLPNRFIAQGEAPGSPPPADYPVAYDAAKQLHAAAGRQGGSGFAAQFAAHWAGSGASRARALPAAELMAVLGQELGLNRIGIHRP